MLELARAFVTDHSEHPILVTLFIMAAVFVAGGIAVDQITGNGVASAFFIVYAIVATFLGATGYTVLLAARLVTKVQRQMGIAS